jgi:glycosyltransferase involved in cell wall biosynthesis
MLLRRTKVLVCGNFGRGDDAVDGQSIKTRVLTNALAAAGGDEAVLTLNTADVFTAPVWFYRSARAQFAQCTHVLILPGPLAVHALVPLFARWGMKDDKDIRYVVIGGFLPDYASQYPWVRRGCAQLDGIYVETASMAARMQSLGLNNVKVLPNFRCFAREMPRRYERTTMPLKLVFCSRIFKDKGIEEAIAAVERLNREAGADVACLDVFGPIERPYQDQFTARMLAAKHCSYRGVLESDRLYDVLQRYDFMLFPTYYYGEGFAGCIVDAFIAGVPVIASDWGYNAEVVHSGLTGEIVKAGSVDALSGALWKYIREPGLVANMRDHCIKSAEAYHSDNALTQLMQDIEIGHV